MNLFLGAQERSEVFSRYLNSVPNRSFVLMSQRLLEKLRGKAVISTTWLKTCVTNCRFGRHLKSRLGLESSLDRSIPKYLVDSESTISGMLNLTFRGCG